MTDVKTVILEGGKVKIEDLGTVPDNAEAICITSTEKMTAQAIQEKNDERNDDFALIPAVNAGKTWSAAIPDETSAFMKIVNARANSKISVKINGYNSNGEQTGEKTVFLEGGFAFGFRPEDIGRDCVAFIAEADKENLEATAVAVVTEDPRLTMNWRGKTIVDLSRAFLNTNGVTQVAKARITAPDADKNYRLHAIMNPDT